ncbi:MAG: hypothetical protein ACF787_06665 [Rhodopirellula sp. JB053]|uniref:hypothetical protein n=1 Tax=Rhodopirellula sp. JB044 TaxID=3342844 RepID=UPI003709EA64
MSFFKSVVCFSLLSIVAFSGCGGGQGEGGSVTEPLPDELKQEIQEIETAPKEPV